MQIDCSIPVTLLTSTGTDVHTNKHPSQGFPRAGYSNSHPRLKALLSGSWNSLISVQYNDLTHYIFTRKALGMYLTLTLAHISRICEGMAPLAWIDHGSWYLCRCTSAQVEVWWEVSRGCCCPQRLSLEFKDVNQYSTIVTLFSGHAGSESHQTTVDKTVISIRTMQASIPSKNNLIFFIFHCICNAGVSSDKTLNPKWSMTAGPAVYEWCVIENVCTLCECVFDSSFDTEWSIRPKKKSVI